MTFVSSLSPAILWKHFDALLAIPRGSRNEQAAAEYVLSIARCNGCTGSRDKVGNVIIRKPASPGCGARPVVALQSHLDMVCEKNAGTSHDFKADAIVPRREGDWLYATGTTLGADNGMGVAAMCAVMEDPGLKSGPLELLFTIDEETGLNGALGLEAGVLKATRLINLDGEEDDTFIIGCAGGAGVTLTLPLAFEAAPSTTTALQVSVTGLSGGHSGMDIHLQRGNAIKLLTRCLYGIGRTIPLRLASLQGGNVRNAIPREAFATILIDRNSTRAFVDECARRGRAIAHEYGPVDPGFSLVTGDTPMPAIVMSRESSGHLLSLLTVLPHGVAAMSNHLPGLVESSSNLASVRQYDDHASIHVSNRSSDPSAIQALQDRVIAAGTLAGCSADEIEGYPGWNPNNESPLLKIAMTVANSISGKQSVVKAVHAGLECGIIGEKHPGMDMISIGPHMEHPHSPEERVLIPSVERFYGFLVKLLGELA